MINYAPIIDTSIPGFLIETDLKAKMVTVYFKHNIAVSKNDVAKMKVIIKPYSSVSQTTIIAEGETAGTDTNHSYHNLDKGKLVISSLPVIGNKGYVFEEGVYYKVQIAYMDKQGNTGPYSSVGVARCLGRKGETGLSIEGLKVGDLVNNAPKKSYVGRFNHDTSITENVYQYRFYLKKAATSTIIKDTGWLTPINDNNNKPIMVFDVPDELKIDELYKLHFEIVTVNGYSIGIDYNIKGLARDYPNTYKELIVASQDADAIENGYVKVELIPRNGTYLGNSTASGPDTPNGDFYLLRRELDSMIWEQLVDFSLTQLSNLQNFVWKDFSVESGKTYIYAVQQYYKDPNTHKIFYSDKVISQIPITAEFENMFLSDGERQLAIRFNPKVSSMKTTILENKVDTLGGKYPFFARNGSINYKEIPISGLISYHMDPNSLFLVDNELGLINNNDLRNKTPHLEKEEKTKKLHIKGLNANKINNNQLYYIGDNDFNEKENGKIIAYRFFFYDINNPDENLGDQPWQPPERDNFGKPVMEFLLNYDLKKNETYAIVLKVTTSTGQTFTSHKYYISNSIHKPSINLTSENFKLEKDFKTLVYDWLNNGKPKFFRSPTEGNFILRLMNISLSPNDTVGRMLHTFKATGYEMAECSIKELQERHLIQFNKYGNEQNFHNYSKILRQVYNIEKGSCSDTTYIPIIIKNSTSQIIFKKNLILDNSEASSHIDTKGFYVWLKNGEPYADTSENLKIYVYGESSPQWKGPISNLVRLGNAQKKFFEFAEDSQTAAYDIRDNRIKNMFYANIYDKYQNLWQDRIRLCDWKSGQIKSVFYVKENIVRDFFDCFGEKDYIYTDTDANGLPITAKEILKAYGFQINTSLEIRDENNEVIDSYTELEVKNWYSLYNTSFEGKRSSVRVDCQRLASTEKAKNTNIEPFYGEIIVLNNEVNSARASSYKEYNVRAKYSKIEKISLYAQGEVEDPWAAEMYLNNTNKNTFVTKEMQRLFRINKIENLFAGENTDYFIEQAKIITKEASDGIWYKQGQPLKTGTIQPNGYSKMSQDSKRNWVKTKIIHLLEERDINDNAKKFKDVTSAQKEHIAETIKNNLAFTNKENPLEITNWEKAVNVTDNYENNVVYIYFKDGTSQRYAGAKKNDRFSLHQLKEIRNYDQIIKIRPGNGTKITFTGLFSYATSPRLGRFRLGNSRIGDEYING